MIKRVSFSDILKATAPSADDILDQPIVKKGTKRKHVPAQAQKYSLVPKWRRRRPIRIAKENMPKPK